MKRVLLFLATNLAIMLVLSVTLRLLGVERILDEQGSGLNINSLLVFALVFGMGGSFISLAISKWTAKRFTGAQDIARPRSEPRCQRRYGDAGLDPRRGQHLRYLPVAGDRPSGRPGGIQERARPRPGVLDLHYRRRAGAGHTRQHHRDVAQPLSRVPRRRRRCPFGGTPEDDRGAGASRPGPYPAAARSIGGVRYCRRTRARFEAAVHDPSAAQRAHCRVALACLTLRVHGNRRDSI